MFNDLSSNLQADDIGAALDLTGGDSEDSYINRLSDFNLATSLFMTQVSGAGQDFITLLEEQLDFNQLEAELGDRLSDLYIKIMTLEFSDAGDILYIAERNKIVAVIDSLISKLDQLENSLEEMSTTIADLDLTPAIIIKNASLVSDETGEDTINSSPEIFTLKARVKNISSVSVSGLSAELTVDTANDSITASPFVESPVVIGTLSADDGVDGSGSDETDIEWKVSYNGDLNTEVIFLSMGLLENGDAASTFVTRSNLKSLTVDPLADDKDLDLIPDNLEEANGLDTTKDDALEDKDSDWLTNFEEIINLGTDPQVIDTDGDTLSDREEATGGDDGFITDPLNTDTDRDGVPDNSDGQPVDGGTSEEPVSLETVGEPEVSIDKTEVEITKDERIATVNVTNSGDGILTWSASSDNDAIVVVSPEESDLRSGDGILVISSSENYDFETSGTNVTTVTVIDITGATKDTKEITVKVGTGKERTPPDDDGDGTEEPPDEKSFTFSCEHGLIKGNVFGIETLSMNLGDTENCTLKLNDRVEESLVEVSTLLRQGGSQAIKIDPANDFTDENGELNFTITAINEGKDWAAWAIRNDKGNFEFSKKTYDTGLAWGMFVDVKKK